MTRSELRLFAAAKIIAATYVAMQAALCVLDVLVIVL